VDTFSFSSILILQEDDKEIKENVRGFFEITQRRKSKKNVYKMIFMKKTQKNESTFSNRRIIYNFRSPLTPA